MTEFTELIFEAQKDLFKNVINETCLIYNEKYHNINKIYENNKLVGLCIYQDYEDKRIIYEFHFIGKNKYSSFKLWRKVFDKNKVILCSTLKNNTKILNFLKRLGFKEYKIQGINIYLEYRGC